LGETVEYNNDLYTLLVDTIGNVQNLHHRDFEQVPATMAGNVRQLSAGVYRLDLDLLVVLDVDRVLDAERLMKTSPVVLKRTNRLSIKGLNRSHFEKIAGHLHATLKDLSVLADIIGEVMTLAATARDDVLNY
jgi:hypothetical protein